MPENSKTKTHEHTAMEGLLRGMRKLAMSEQGSRRLAQASTLLDLSPRGVWVDKDLKKHRDAIMLTVFEFDPKETTALVARIVHWLDGGELQAWAEQAASKKNSTALKAVGRHARKLRGDGDESASLDADKLAHRAQNSGLGELGQSLSSTLAAIQDVAGLFDLPKFFKQALYSYASPSLKQSGSRLENFKELEP